MPRLRRELPRGNGQPLIIVPGFGTTDVATAPLRRLLNGLGYASYGLGLGRNLGMRSGVRDALTAQLRAVHTPTGTVTLAGWSLRGVFSRSTALHTPQAARAVCHPRRAHNCAPKPTTT